MSEHSSPSSKDLVFIKLGGAAITFKNRKNEANFEVLKQVSKEISNVSKNYKVLVGHGGGSFPHPVAAEYNVQEGLEVCGAEGFSKTQEAARTLNNIVIKSLNYAGVSALPIQTSACTVGENGNIKKIYSEPIKMLLEKDLVPVVYGDVVVDTEKGCTIASTEMIFNYLAKKLKPSQIIVGTDVEGVYTKDPKEEKGELIPEINKENFKEILEKTGKTSSIDVTGGMKHKIKSLYEMSKSCSKVRVINILKRGNIKKAVSGEKIGTVITSC